MGRLLKHLLVAAVLLIGIAAVPLLRTGASAQTAPAVDSSTAQTEENLRASRAGLEAERKQLEVERLQAEQAADHAAAARLVQELELVSRLDLLFLQQMSALQRMTELEAERAQLLQEKASVPAPPKPADKPTFSMLEDLRSQLAGQRERQLEIELNLASSARALEDAAAVLEQKESARRKVKEEADTADLPIQRVEREGLLRAAVLESRLQRQIVEVRASERKNWELALEAAKLRLELIQRRIAASKPQVQMSENDLVQALSGLDAREKSLRSALEEAKGRLALCERRFFEARAKVQAGVQIEQQLGEQIETQRVCRDAAQEEMSILGERLAMAASSREIWQRRFKLHHGDYRGADLKIWHAEVSAVLKGVEQRDRMQNSHQTALRGELKRIAARIDADRDAGGNLGSLLAKQRTQLRKTESVYGDYSEDNEALRKLAEKLAAELSEVQGEAAFWDSLQVFWTALSGVWNYELFAVADHPITLHKIVVALIIVVLGFKLSRMLSRKFALRVLPRLGINAGEAAAFEALVFYALVVFFVLFSLQVVHVPLTVFTLLGGAVAIGVGFGSQNIMNNFISGLILLVERPIRAGDLVEVDTYQGRVEKIGARSTRIITFNNIDLVVPNSLLLEKTVVNWTLSDEMARSRISVGAAYGSAPEQVKELLLEAVLEQPDVLREPAPFAVFAEFGDSALIFNVYFWLSLRAARTRPAVESDIRCRILELFRQNGIEIPFPQRTVLLRTSEVPGKLNDSA